jgi:hypothetical protein
MQRKILIPLVLSLTLILVVAGSILFLAYLQQPNTSSPFDNSSSSTSSSLQSTGIVTRRFDVGEQVGMGGVLDTQLSMQVLSDWNVDMKKEIKETTLEVNGRKVNHKSYCYSFEISDAEQKLKLYIQEVCGGWAAAYESYNPKSTIIFNSSKQLISGPSNFFRLRIPDGAKAFHYADAYLDGNETLDTLPSDKREIMDAMIVDYSSPATDDHEGPFMAMRATLTLSDDIDPEMIKSADKVISSLDLIDVTVDHNEARDKFVPVNGLNYLSKYDYKDWYAGQAINSNLIDGYLYQMNFYVYETDQLKTSTYGGDATLLTQITARSGEQLYIVKSKGYVVLSSCAPKDGYGCSPTITDGYLLAWLEMYPAKSQTPGTLDFKLNSTTKAISDFTEVVKSLKLN